MSDFTVHGAVLSVMPIGEYDRRLELLTKEAGRISVFARGSRRPASALSGACRVFAFGTFELFQGKSSYSLKNARIMNYFNEMTEDFERSCYGYYFLEVCRYFSRENLEAGDVLNLLYLSLKALNSENYENALVRSVFEVKMLQINGICPPPEKVKSGLGRYGFAKELSEGAFYTLNFVVSSEISGLFSFRLSDENFKAFKSIADHLMADLVGERFKSLEILETITDLE